MLLLDKSDYPSIEELSRPELHIAGLRINPDNYGPSRPNYLTGMKSHGYRAKESIMHMLWEMDQMLETYVKPKQEMKAVIPSK